jgi:uncharacterized protein (DUF849 family)
MLQACLNGARTRDEHPAVPRTPVELAADGRATVAAGARVLHFHLYDDAGRETFDAEVTAAALLAVREACPGIPISLSTSELIEPHPRRLQSIATWKELPELITANQGEAGIEELCRLLMSRGVGIEAGLLELSDAHRFVERDLARTSTRVLVEPLDRDPEAAVAHAARIGEVVAAAGVRLPQVHRRGRRQPVLASRCAPGCTRASARSSGRTWAESPSTSAPGSPPWREPDRYWSRAPCGTWSPAQASSSKAWAHMP